MSDDLVHGKGGACSCCGEVSRDPTSGRVRPAESQHRH